MSERRCGPTGVAVLKVEKRVVETVAEMAEMTVALKDVMRVVKRVV